MRAVADPYHVLQPSPRPGMPDWMSLELASRYISFAAGAYGWPHFSAAYGPRACCYIGHEMAVPCCRNPTVPPAEIVLDNSCYCNTAVLMYMTDPKAQGWTDDGKLMCNFGVLLMSEIWFNIYDYRGAFCPWIYVYRTMTSKGVIEYRSSLTYMLNRAVKGSRSNPLWFCVLRPFSSP